MYMGRSQSLILVTALIQWSSPLLKPAKSSGAISDSGTKSYQKLFWTKI